MCFTPHSYTALARDLAQPPQPTFVQMANAVGSASFGSLTPQPPLESPPSNGHVVDHPPNTTFIPAGFPGPATEPTDTAQPDRPSYVSADGLTGPGVHAPVPIYASQGVDGRVNAPTPIPSRMPSWNAVLHASEPRDRVPNYPPPPYAPYAGPGVGRPSTNPTRVLLPFPAFVTTPADINFVRWRGNHGLLLLSENRIGQRIDGKPKFLRVRARVAIDRLRNVTSPGGPALCGALRLVPSQYSGRALDFHRSMEAICAMEAMIYTHHPRWFTFIRPYHQDQYQMSLLVLEDYPIHPIVLDSSGLVNPGVTGSLVGQEVDAVFICYQFMAPGHRLISLALLVELQLID
ncbi:hypothetical protein BDN72DRAFT_902897 [Pluteus cervinus]|uniref:Uncharacterized protein n=1 Tax=Pluteus cervinus TaxID=181527 RepID=A0ACD3ABZ0_9AGAR|nr:hypothetical protein BDN72DRAFT_902897 [Pluteus cervinus]